MGVGIRLCLGKRPVADSGLLKAQPSRLRETGRVSIFWMGAATAQADRMGELFATPDCWYNGWVQEGGQMHPEDRVLVAVMNRPQDFEIAREQGWYRIPEARAPKGVLSEYVAFYFTAAFPEKKWGIYYYARRLGHELALRRDLLPYEADHPRAGARYYKLQLGRIQRKEPPILSQRWRRIAFIHTTWDRFADAEEINDLFATGDVYVDRVYTTLRDAGLAPERCFPIRESGAEYIAEVALPCQAGVVVISPDQFPDPVDCADAARKAVAAQGGPWWPSPRARLRRSGANP
jgi:hypothetical protein